MTDVIVVGAGPTGLLLAADLAEAGVNVTIVEKRNSGQSNLTRAFGVHARTMEAFDARGLIDQLLADTVCRVPRISLFDHVTVDFRQLPTRYNWMLITPQYNVERILLDRTHRLGVPIRYDTEVTGLRQDRCGVDVDVRSLAHGTTQTLHASYVVGCDGIRSTVRALADLPFPGHEFLRSMMLADVRLPAPPPGDLSIHVKAHTTRGFAAVVPYGEDDWWRIVCWHRDHADDAAAPTLEQVADVVAEAHGTDYGMREPRWLSRFAADERQVPTYRHGRVFVAGDAAHQHSPAGAQGMNVGLQDAAALAWRLTAVLRGAPEDLLDGYHTERHPVGRRVIRSAGGIIRAAIGHTVLRDPIRAALRLPPVADSVSRQLAGTNIRYPRPPGAHHLVGTHAPDTPLHGGGRLHQALRTRRHVLATRPPVRFDGWHDRVSIVSHAEAGQPSMLVRPDGYVAWASDTTDPAHLAATLPQVLTSLCGQPDTNRRHAV
ncbi:MAG: FAD-dependent oxidoreductase [Micromonosporaceae bacterium]